MTAMWPTVRNWQCRCGAWHSARPGFEVACPFCGSLNPPRRSTAAQDGAAGTPGSPDGTESAQDDSRRTDVEER